jgi:YVTN family beta-propeller protein
MTHFSSSSLRLSRAEKDNRIGPLTPALTRRLGLLSLVCLLGWSPVWSQQVYVTDTASGVSVIDSSTNTVVNTVPVTGESFGVAITPNGQFAYVSNNFPGVISVINTSTHAIVDTVAVGDNPYGIAITPNGQYAYVTNGDSSVLVIATSTNTVIATIGVGENPTQLGITPNGQYAYVSNTSGNTVSVIATSTNTVIATIGVGDMPEGVAITPNGQFAYVTNFFDDTVSVINTSTNTVVSTVPVTGEQPEGIAITPNGQFAYVSNFTTPNVSVIDLSTNTVVNTVTLAGGGTGVAITPNGQFAYVSNFGNDVSVINISTNTVVGTVFVGGIPLAVAITPTVPFSSFKSGLVIDTGTHPGFLVTSTFTLGSSSSGLQAANEAMTLQIANYTLNLPSGSFQPLWNAADAPYVYEGTVNGANLLLAIVPLGANKFAFEAAGSPVAFPGVTNPVAISLFFGNNSGTTSVKALISP